MLIKLEKKKAHQKYITSTGIPVPGCTTVLGILDKPALINWAYNLGKQGIDLNAARQSALDAGTGAHFMVECYLQGNTWDLSCLSADDIALAEIAFAKFKDFWRQECLKFVASEVQITSDQHLFGGTIDIVARDKKGNAVLIDIKTSKAIYDEYKTQVSAYERLWNDLHPEDQITRRAIVRIGKEKDDSFEVCWFSNSDKHWTFFEALIKVYWAKKALKD